jgi:hypothetical protein
MNILHHLYKECEGNNEEGCKPMKRGFEAQESDEEGVA